MLGAAVGRGGAAGGEEVGGREDEGREGLRCALPAREGLEGFMAAGVWYTLPLPPWEPRAWSAGDLGPG
jgi:hypothetical protein